MRSDRLTLIKRSENRESSDTAKYRDFSLASAKLGDFEITNKEQLDFDVVVANNLERRKQCCNLAFQEYSKKGYVTKSEKPFIVNKFDNVEDSIIFAVRNESKDVIGTLTIIPDSEIKLPSDLVFNKELDELRLQNMKIFEFSRLAIRSDMKNQFDLLAALINYGGLYAFHFLKADIGVIEVNPHHSGFYEKLLFAKRLTEVRLSPFVANAPAILLSLSTNELIESTAKARDLNKYPELKRTYFPIFFRDHSEERIIEYIKHAKKSISIEEKKYFGLQVD